MTRPVEAAERRSEGAGAGVRELLIGPQARRVGGVALGTAAGSAALLLASPVLTRLYAPAEFGAYAYFFAALGFLAPVAALRLELAIPIPDKERDAWSVALTAFAATALVAVVALLGTIAFVKAGPERLAGTGGLGGAVWALPPALLVSGAYQTLTYWAVRRERFRPIALARGGVGGASALGQIAFGMVRSTSLGLVAGDLTGRTVATLTLAGSLSLSLREGGPVPPVELWRTAKRYGGFPLLSAPAAMVNAAALLLPLVAAGELYGAAAAGWMFLAQRVIALPTTLLTTATSQVYVADFARMRGAERVTLYRRTLLRLAVIGAGPVIAAGALSPLLFPVVFGAEWVEAGRLGLALAPLYAFQLLSGATVSTLDVLELHRARLGRELVLLAVTVGVLAAGYGLQLSLPTLVLAYGLCGGAFYGVSIAWIHRILSKASR